jgi:hypothetical protein
MNINIYSKSKVSPSQLTNTPYESGGIFFKLLLLPVEHRVSVKHSVSLQFLDRLGSR